MKRSRSEIAQTAPVVPTAGTAAGGAMKHARPVSRGPPMVAPPTVPLVVGPMVAPIMIPVLNTSAGAPTVLRRLPPPPPLVSKPARGTRRTRRRSRRGPATSAAGDEENEGSENGHAVGVSGGRTGRITPVVDAENLRMKEPSPKVTGAAKPVDNHPAFRAILGSPFMRKIVKHKKKPAAGLGHVIQDRKVGPSILRAKEAAVRSALGSLEDLVKAARTLGDNTPSPFVRAVVPTFRTMEEDMALKKKLEFDNLGAI